jgi:hypothetical protein
LRNAVPITVSWTAALFVIPIAVGFGFHSLGCGTALFVVLMFLDTAVMVGGRYLLARRDNRQPPPTRSSGLSEGHEPSRGGTDEIGSV